MDIWIEIFLLIEILLPGHPVVQQDGDDLLEVVVVRLEVGGGQQDVEGRG